MNKLFTLLKNTFYPNNEEYYDFTLPENEIENSENTETNSSENILTKTNMELILKKIQKMFFLV